MFLVYDVVWQVQEIKSVYCFFSKAHSMKVILLSPILVTTSDPTSFEVSLKVFANSLLKYRPVRLLKYFVTVKL